MGRDYKVDACSKTSTVFQGVFLFDDTIENNTDATHEQVAYFLAKRACCVKSLSRHYPPGYETR